MTFTWQSSPFLYADATVSMETNEYTFEEDNGTVSVCAEIIVPAGGLECDVIATLTLTDGTRASKLCLHMKELKNREPIYLCQM